MNERKTPSHSGIDREFFYVCVRSLSAYALFSQDAVYSSLNSCMRHDLQ